MALTIDDDTRMLRDSAARYFAEADATKALRRGRGARDLDGLALGAWKGMVELGLAGILVPESFGGTGMGYAASIHVSEMMGRSLASGPFLSTAIMAATALRDGDNGGLKAALLPRIAAGTVVAVAAEETARHCPTLIETRARRIDGAFRISGRKVAVIDGNIAAKLIVAARLADGDDRLGLFAVDVDTPGVTIQVGLGVDSRPCVEIAFQDVSAGHSDLVCAPDKSWPLLERVLDSGRLHLAAEMLGLAQEAFDRTVEYLKTRVQFGRKIGEFQALQHRAALLFGDLEIARSVVLKAAAESEEDGRFAERVSLAKAKVGEVSKRVTTEAVQLHGGIGVTDDFDIGLYLKRARAAAEQLGDWAFHAERYAQIQGL